jgi:hypothetical protein
MHRVLVQKLEGRRSQKTQALDRRIILKWIFKKWNGGGGMNWIDLA